MPSVVALPFTTCMPSCHLHHSFLSYPVISSFIYISFFFLPYLLCQRLGDSAYHQRTACVYFPVSDCQGWLTNSFKSEYHRYFNGELNFLNRFLKFIFRERGREEERGRETSMCGCLSHGPTRGPRYPCNPGMCPDWESNLRLFSSQPILSPLSYTSQGGNLFKRHYWSK